MLVLCSLATVFGSQDNEPVFIFNFSDTLPKKSTFVQKEHCYTIMYDREVSSPSYKNGTYVGQTDYIFIP